MALAGVQNTKYKKTTVLSLNLKSVILFLNEIFVQDNFFIAEVGYILVRLISFKAVSCDISENYCVLNCKY